MNTRKVSVEPAMLDRVRSGGQSPWDGIHVGVHPGRLHCLRKQNPPHLHVGFRKKTQLSHISSLLFMFLK
jgi:hypothetical protein